MKKLLFVVAAAIGIAAIAKSRSEQLKAGAQKVTSDPRVQSALATASEKAAPVASTVKEKAGPVVSSVSEKAGPVVSSVGEKVSHATEAATSFAQERLHHSQEPAEAPAEAAPVDVPEVPAAAEELVEENDPVSAPEFTGFEPPADSAEESPQGGQPGE